VTFLSQSRERRGLCSALFRRGPPCYPEFLKRILVSGPTMFGFAHPLWLLLLLVVPLVTAAWLWQRRGSLTFSDTRLLDPLPRGSSRIARWAGAGMRALALVLLVAAMAGPRMPDRTPLPTEGIAITMVVDVSGSMAEPDFLWENHKIRRIDAVKNAFRLFVQGGNGPGGVHLEGRPYDLVGLVTFAAEPDGVCPLTLSHPALLELLTAEEPRTLPGESRTNISDGIAWGLHQLENAGTQRRVMILLSDGEHNVPDPAPGAIPWTPQRAAESAANRNIPIYTIDAGGEGGSEEGEVVNRQKAVETLQEIAQRTGGRYFQAQDSASLLAACQEIDRLERQPIQSFQYRRYHEYFSWFGLAAVLSWVTIRTLESTLWRRVP
jgi:Ca-activated chloride channel family protein